MKCDFDCEWMYDEPSAGLANYCNNENMTEEEHECYKDSRRNDCTYYKQREENNL